MSQLVARNAAPLEIREAGQHVVAAVCDIAAALNVQIPPAWLGVIGRGAKTLFEAGFEVDTIVAASWLAVKRGRPQLVQTIAGELAVAVAGQTVTRGQYETALAVQAAGRSSNGIRAGVIARQQEIERRRAL